jgi:hypothetical protein
MITKTIEKKNVVYDLIAKPVELKELVADIQSNFTNKSIQIVVSRK